MSKIIRGYKFRIYPTEEQACQIDRFIDLTRYVYNWGIAKEQEIYEQYKNGLSEYSFYSYFDLTKLFTEFRNDPNNGWILDIPVATCKNSLRNVVNGYKMFFDNINPNKPYFKSKKKCKKSFNTRNDRFKVENDCIKIEGIDSRISLGFNSGLNINRNIRKDKNKAINPTIFKDNLGNYYVSFSMEEELIGLPALKDEGVGIDLGIRKTFTLSTGEIFIQPKEKLDRLENKRRKQQRHVTRDINRRLEESRRTKTKYEDIPKSKRAIKRELKLNKIYKKIHNIKNTFYHTITKRIVDRNPAYVCMETFSVKDNINSNKYTAKFLVNTSFYDITQKMKYKCENRNIPFIQAPKSYTSTQICSNCGGKKKMYSYHTYKCPICGMVEDRDINAAINLRNYGYNYLNGNSQLIA